MEWISLLQTLTGPPGPPGFETAAVSAALSLLAPLMDKTYTDTNGNLIGVRYGQPAGDKPLPRVLLDAHLDEIGVIVTGHREGFLQFAPLGGLDPALLPGRMFTLLTTPPRAAVVTALPPHLQGEDKGYPSAQTHFLDAGLTIQAAEQAVPVGTPGVYHASCVPLGAHRVAARALDNRAGFALLLRTLELLGDTPLAFDLFVCGSCQEELGMRGIVPVAFAVEPDLCIAVDATFGRAPEAPEHTFPLGKGPAIGLGPNCTRSLSDLLQKVAQDHHIPHQCEVMEGSSGTNAWPAQISGRGVTTGIISFPVRNMHAPVEIADLRDLEGGAQLLSLALRALCAQCQTEGTLLC